MSASICRSCGAPLTGAFADLGVQPISNAFRSGDQQSLPETFYPLRALVCASCFLVQLQGHSPREAHFNQDYIYFSSFSDSWQAHAREYAAGMIERFGLGPSSLVVELASNDGYLLRHFKNAGIPRLGIEPSASVAQAAIAAGIDTRIAFFGRALAGQLLQDGFAADLMPANNVLAHVPDINDFVAGVGMLLKPSGIATFEFPHLLHLIREAQFDTIYHEHYSYLSLTALMPLFRRHRLTVFDVATLPTHGGSLRVFVAPQHPGREVSRRVAEQLDIEATAGLADIATYSHFGMRIDGLKRSLLMLLCELKQGGARIAAYGAPAKGNTLLNYTGIRTDFIDFTVDRNPAKQGMFLPGTGIPVLPLETIQQRKPDYLLVLPWNLADEIMSQQAGISAWGGRFILPMPQPKVVDPLDRR